VIRSDVLDIDPGNHRATIIADLRASDRLPAESYDCFILTQTLHLIDDIQAAVATAYRALKPGGVLLATLPCVSMVAEEYGASGDHWRVTEAGARRLFNGVFPPELVETRARGNVLAATAFLYGLSCEELEPGELDADDPAYPVIVTVRAVKPSRAPATLVPDRQRRGSVILLYHQIARRNPDVHCLAVPPDVFRAQIEYLTRCWHPMDLGDMAEAAVNGEVPEGGIALTFDDGYVDNLECAVPILAEFKVPATFFLTTERLDHPRTYWWDSLEAILLGSDRPAPAVTLRIDGKARIFSTAHWHERRAAHDILYPILKSSPPAVRDDLLRQLAMAARVTPSPVGGRPLLAEEIKTVATMPSVSLGAHGVHHLSLPGLKGEQLHQEVFECRTALERTAGQSLSLFAYPFGDVSPETAEMVRAADYQFAVTSDPRPLGPREHPLRLPRLKPPTSAGDDFAAWLNRQAGPRMGNPAWR
jgi:peptidoglycan/xylan/chitin deacetylase (PgdA/CDA1 family)